MNYDKGSGPTQAFSKVLSLSNVCFLGWATQTKLTPNETTPPTLKARGARRAALGSGLKKGWLIADKKLYQK